MLTRNMLYCEIATINIYKFSQKTRLICRQESERTVRLRSDVCRLLLKLKKFSWRLRRGAVHFLVLSFLQLAENLQATCSSCKNLYCS